jgi:hypothetical protein
MNRYPYGYTTPPLQLTIPELETRITWRKLDPEFRRRLEAMFAAAHDAGVSLGIGGGWRSSEVQRATFLARHVVVTSGGCCTYEGKRYALKPGVAHAAPPMSSYHESTQADGDALAADLIGDLLWMNVHCGEFDLIHFGGVNREPWHVQPVEIPTGRPRYDGSELIPWVPPGVPVDPDDGDELEMIVTNSEPFYGAAPGVAKFLVQDAVKPGAVSRLKMLTPAEWRARGSLSGVALSNEDIGALGVDVPS